MSERHGAMVQGRGGGGQNCTRSVSRQILVWYVAGANVTGSRSGCRAIDVVPDTETECVKAVVEPMSATHNYTG